ncbi:hypothetical protein [Altericista sp. CCNU0014]|uniref:hypothetical protein n=1 Tax=Altericista sp. CCNU0014 TaxID=3082949 RepID=UPI00385177B9
MSKHDSWVYLIPNSPFQDILETFSEGFPVRDPFPMVLQQTQEGSVVPCWTFDLLRMSSPQVVLLASAFARAKKMEFEAAIADFRSNGANLSCHWVDRLECGPEGRARTAEIREFFAAHPDPSPEKLLTFYRRQKQKWVEGNAQPEAELFVGQLGRLQWMPRTQQVNRL